nr:hypothetical protein [Tanacetum cinerariifolium]
MRVVHGVLPKQLSEIVAFVVFESPLPSAPKEEDCITYNLVKQFLYNDFLDEDGEDFVLHYLPDLGEITYSLENLIMTEIFEKAFDK